MGAVVMVAQDVAGDRAGVKQPAPLTGRGPGARRTDGRAPRGARPSEGEGNRQCTYFALSPPKESDWTGVAP